MSSKDKKELSKNSKKATVVVPSIIPRDKFKLTKLEDGYKLYAADEKSHKDERGSSKTSHSFYIEEHYGRPVKDVHGDFKEDGQYDVSLAFEDE